MRVFETERVLILHLHLLALWWLSFRAPAATGTTVALYCKAGDVLAPEEAPG